MKKDYFDYPLPSNKELKELYPMPYRFNNEIRFYIDYIFKHPYNKNRKVYAETRSDWDTNDMAKGLYVRVKYFLDHPQQFGGALDNIAAPCLVAMWKTFLSINKNIRGKEFRKYYVTDMKLLQLVKGPLFEKMLETIRNEDFYMTGDDMIKVREGVGLREKRIPKRKQRQGSHLEYLCSLE